jgi:hypothetical protein
MLISSVVEVVAELKPKGYHHPQSIATASARRRKEWHSDDTARRPRVNTDRRRVASGPPGRQAYRVVHVFSGTDTR